MSPLSAPEPCPNLVVKGTFHFCGDYEHRPEECVNHDFPAHVCPIGAGMLDIRDAEAMRQRVDAGFAMLRYPTLDLSNALRTLYGA